MICRGRTTAEDECSTPDGNDRLSLLANAVVDGMDPVGCAVASHDDVGGSTLLANAAVVGSHAEAP